MTISGILYISNDISLYVNASNQWPKNKLKIPNLEKHSKFITFSVWGKCLCKYFAY
jgi:hypothetical protein